MYIHIVLHAQNILIHNCVKIIQLQAIFYVFTSHLYIVFIYICLTSVSVYVHAVYNCIFTFHFPLFYLLGNYPDTCIRI
jgi:hypothetical protein